jgi:hypothetical protein
MDGPSAYHHLKSIISHWNPVIVAKERAPNKDRHRPTEPPLRDFRDLRKRAKEMIRILEPPQAQKNGVWPVTD